MKYLDELIDLVSNDATAISYQSMAQYRKMLIDKMKSIKSSMDIKVCPVCHGKGTYMSPQRIPIDCNFCKGDGKLVDCK